MDDKTMPAFPGYSEQTGPWFGMTLRQYYAGQFLAGQVAKVSAQDVTTRDISVCVDLAECLIAELDK